MLEHDPREFLAEHPDRPERIAAIESALASHGGLAGLGWERRVAPAATRAELEGVHDPALIDMVQGLCAAGGGCIDDDTYVNRSSLSAALHASGAACGMVRALVAGEAEVGFAAVRPAGHHAERSRAMGFCLFNNVAVAAQLAIAELGVRARVHPRLGRASRQRHGRDLSPPRRRAVRQHPSGGHLPRQRRARRCRLGTGIRLHDQSARPRRGRQRGVALAAGAHRAPRRRHLSPRPGADLGRV